jgi:hypothetical protein
MTNDGLPSVTCRRDKESSHAEPAGGAALLACACAPMRRLPSWLRVTHSNGTPP